MDDGNGDSGARPTELLIAALGGCTGMDVVSIAIALVAFALIYALIEALDRV